MALIDEIKKVFKKNNNQWMTATEVYEQVDEDVFGPNVRGSIGHKNMVSRDLSQRYARLFEEDSNSHPKRYRLLTDSAEIKLPVLDSQKNDIEKGFYEEPAWGDIVSSIRKSGLRISDSMLRRYHISLETRGFVILSGISGTGKTWLAEAYANAVKAEYCIIPVAANWTTNEDLLGFFNPFSENGPTYQDTEFSGFLRAAEQNYKCATSRDLEATPFHLVLDEMNLARVEYYFAKVLSAMEQRDRNGVGRITLGPYEDVLLTPNLYVIGTVNIDETTHGFADKVYDRAQLIELTISREDVAQHLTGQPYASVVLELWESLHEIAPFAFRTLDEIKKYTEKASEYEISWQIAVDEQILQKVLPKINGFDSRIENALELVIDIATNANLEGTRGKAESMLKGYKTNGLTSFF